MPGIQTCFDVVGRIRKVISQSKVGETKKIKTSLNKSLGFCLMKPGCLVEMSGEYGGIKVTREHRLGSV